jgi:hypothetical protein
MVCAKMTDDIKIRQRLEDISETHKKNCQKWADILPKKFVNEERAHASYCDGLDVAYQIFCEESNIPYKPLKRGEIKK